MKRWLLLCLACLPLGAHAQVAWPRNAKNEIEFVGVIPWPADAQSEVQRRALVKDWYQRKLTSINLSDSSKLSRFREPTWNDLPSYTGINCREGEGEDTEYFGLRYHVQFIPGAAGLSYRLFYFDWGWAQSDAGSSWDLESALKRHNYSPVQLATFTVFRNQLADALMGW